MFLPRLPIRRQVSSPAQLGAAVYHSGTGIIAIDHAIIAADRVGSVTGATNALGGGLFNGAGTSGSQQSGRAERQRSVRDRR